MPTRSPLAPAALPDLPAVAGVRIATAASAIRYRGRDDLCLFAFDPGTAVAGVFTRSLTAAAPVAFCRANLEGGRARAILVNAGNANAFTGRLGAASVDRSAKAVVGALRCRRREVFIASTGVIGEKLQDDKITGLLPELVRRLGPTGWRAAAEAIMTTDTFPKLATREARIGGIPVTLNGIAKGSGMIAPDMATMLAFAVTDAKIPAAILQTLLGRAADSSFNATTVDGDTSTNDTLLLCATGRASRHPVPRSAGDPILRDFRAKLDDLMIDLACQVVRDGEGAQKFITVSVAGAASARAARAVALAIANSPLVKTAIAGADANWGRIVMAVGKSGEKIDPRRLAIAIGGTAIVAKGERVSGYDESPVVAHMRGREIRIDVDLAVGRACATVWTCDLTHGYIDINAAYRS